MLSSLLFSLFSLSALCNAGFYDTFTAQNISRLEYESKEKDEKLRFCVIEVDDCKEDEDRRVDGSCNNPRHPIRGASYTPWTRMLPPNFTKDDNIRKAKSGKDLPLSRKIRTTLMCEGLSYHKRFTVLLTSFHLFISGDAAYPHEDEKIIIRNGDCCKGTGDIATCAPNYVPEDDPVLRYSGYRCMNMTKPLTYVNIGCVKEDPIHSRVNQGTPAADLSMIYGSIKKEAEKGRLYKGGLLMYEMENNVMWPPSVKKDPWSRCRLNAPDEFRCHDTPESNSNGLITSNMVFVWFWRQHNHIAKKLAEVNFCWNDEELFYRARDILISVAYHIYYYELLPLLLGRDYLIENNIISSHQGFRDLYDESLYPQMSLEYRFALRWMHGMQQGTLKMYDEYGNYLKEMPLSNLTIRTGYLVKNIGYLAQGAIRQPSAAIDYKVDPIISEFGFGATQEILDVLTNDNAKSRHEGHQPYIRFLRYCTGKQYRSFEDLCDVIDPHNIKLFQEVYENVEDIDLMAGMWMEKPMDGAAVPLTFACLVGDQLKRNVITDRHWFERSERPNAFTAEQLMEIRKATIARIMCDSADTITMIQPQAFLLAAKGNKMINCEDIDDINYKAWKDEECDECVPE